jgi:hypothetical protein
MVIGDINPIFGRTHLRIDDRLAFVLMPFRDDLDEIYETYVKPTVESKGLQCRRADDIKTGTKIIEDIWHSICQARVIIADLTYKNENVMYELGIAHTLGKDSILISQGGSVDDKFPFDIAHIRIRRYENTVMGAHKLTTGLADALSETLNEKMHHFSSDDLLNIELRNYLQSEYRLRKKRVDYFSHHSLQMLKQLKDQYVELLNDLHRFMTERSQEQLKRTILIAGKWADEANIQMIPFIKEHLDKVEDHLESAWLVNKFPDELSRVADYMNRIRNSNINVLTAAEDLLHIIESIEYKTGRIDLYMDTIEQERRILRLDVANEPKVRPKVES